MLEDFGEKIGGARKDMWRARTLDLRDLAAMNDEERAALVTKDAVWPKPDYEALHREGIPKEVCYYIKSVRDAAPVRPTRKDDAAVFVEMISDIRDTVMACRSREDMACAASCFEKNGYVRRSHRTWSLTEKGACLNNKLFRAVWRGSEAYTLMKEAERKGFLMSKDEKLLRGYDIVRYDPERVVKRPKSSWAGACVEVSCQGGKSFYYPDNEDIDSVAENGWFVAKSHHILRSGLSCREEAERFALKNAASAKTAKRTKTAFRPPQLERIERIGGEDYRFNTHCTGDEYINELGFRGGEYGNWTNQADRQASIDMCYDAFRDLAESTGMSPRGVSLGGKLAIAFGARGKGSALAHYEPMLNVINLTKMKGAGSLGHEWIHALDNHLGHLCGTQYFPKTGYMLSEAGMRMKSTREPEIHTAFQALMDTILYKRENGRRVHTGFYKDAKFFDDSFTKAGHGYWASRCELFARAGAAYLKDKCAACGIRNDYLSGHADAPGVAGNGAAHYISPQGEERKAINAAFDALFEAIRKTGAFCRAA